MFTHLVAGGLVFLLFELISGRETAGWFIFSGGMIGIFPDLLSFFLSGFGFNKWSHKHRDNVSHSIFLPLAIFAVAWPIGGLRVSLMFSAVFLTHTFLDSFGLGWGVKLFYPLSNITLKLFHKKGKIFYTQEEIFKEAERYGRENWFKETLFTWNVIGMTEWVSLFLFIVLIIIL